MSFDHPRMPGVAYNGKIYMLNDNNRNEVLDVASKTWSSWPSRSTNGGVGTCMVIWNQNFLAFGGENQGNVVQVLLPKITTDSN